MTRPKPQAQEELVDRFVDAAELLSGRLTQLASVSRGLALNDVLFSGLRAIPADGRLLLEFQVSMASVVVGATSASTTVVAAAAGPATTAPPEGPGVMPVRPGWVLGGPMVGNMLTIYGQPGDYVWLVVTTRPLPPIAAVGPSAAVAEPIPGASGLVATVPGRYLGFTIAETAGAAAKVRIRDSGASGTILEVITLVANESADEFYEGGVPFATGLYYELVSGAVEGSIRHSGG